MRILAIERDNTACNHYRIIQPLNKLREFGLADTLTIGDWELGSSYAIEKVMESDIILFQRPSNDEWFNFIKICQKHGKIIVTDYDDDPFNTHPLNPAYKFIGTKEYSYKWPTGEVDLLWQDGADGFDIEKNIHRQDMFNASFRKADLVTTTTPILEGFFKELNTSTAVLPNLIDFYYFQKPDFNKKEIRIGYQGGYSHYEDIYMAREAIFEVMRKHDNVKFIYFGDSRFRKLFQDIPTNKFEMHSWVNHLAYPYKLALLNLDIGLCPLVDNCFNHNKSAIKFFEYSAVGAATIASNMPPYSPVMNKDNGILVENTKEDWINALEGLIKDKEKRQKLALNAYDCVYNEHNADDKPHLWRDAYDRILRKDLLEDEDGNDISESTKQVVQTAR